MASITRTGFELDPATYDREAGTCRYEYDPDSTPPGMAVVAAVSETLNEEPTAIESLQNTIDADALGSLVGRRGGRDGDVRISFSFEGLDVTVSSRGVVAIDRSIGDGTGGDGGGHDE